MGQQLGLKGDAYPSVAEAYAAAKAKAGKEDFVFIGGSSYVVADFLTNCV
jgi:dihydrofolate synthase/folylpolyglutamate synthase